MTNSNGNGETFKLVAKTETFMVSTQETTDPDDDTGSGRTIEAKQFDNREQMKSETEAMGQGTCISVDQDETSDGKKVTTVAAFADVNVNDASGNPTTTTRIVTIVAERNDS